MSSTCPRQCSALRSASELLGRIRQNKLDPDDPGVVCTQKNGKALKKIGGHNWFANLHGFVNICKLSVSNTVKDMHSKL